MKLITFFCRKFVEMINSSFYIPARFSRKLRVCLFILVPAFIFLFADAGRAQIFTGTMKCSDTITIDIGNVLIGDNVTDTISLTNGFSIHDSSWKVTQDDTMLRILDSVGLADSTYNWKTFIICNPKGAGSIISAINISPVNDASCLFVIILKANGIGPTKDSSTFSLQDTSKNVIAFQTNIDSVTGHFIFTNDSSASIEINNIYVLTDAAFSITPHPAPSFTLVPGASFTLDINYKPTSIGSDNGYLVISMPTDPILLEVALQGVRTGSDAVQTQQSGTIYFVVYPNPSNGQVTIHTENIAQTHVTITDVLGRTLTEESFNGDWVWSGDKSGTYYVNISATKTDGSYLHEVKRVVITR